MIRKSEIDDMHREIGRRLPCRYAPLLGGNMIRVPSMLSMMTLMRVGHRKDDTSSVMPIPEQVVIELGDTAYAIPMMTRVVDGAPLSTARSVADMMLAQMSLLGVRINTKLTVVAARLVVGREITSLHWNYAEEKATS